MTTDVPAAADLPVADAVPRLREALDAHGGAVLVAPPGAGKTTLVPLVLLDAGWRGDGRIVVLEPRRLAARAAARRLAHLAGEDDVGGRIGYVTRDERRVSRATRVEVVTEGVLVRRLQRDPALDGVAAVVLDEFHERSLQADLALAFAVEAREALRPDLRLLVMSATLAAEPVARLLGDVPVVRAEGHRHEVEVRHRPRGVPGVSGRAASGVPGHVPGDDDLARDVAAATREALDAVDGDVLVFLPGAAEIRRAQRALDDAGLAGPGVLVAPLYGALAPEEQDRALAPAPAGTRKVVLATDIAESSLTIEGVRAVVDAGLVRTPRFDPRTGMSRLATERVSRASAEQRAGRAGRVAPGVCLRLWAEREHAGLEPFARPEIAAADLAGLVLESACWGTTDPAGLPLLDAPPARAWAGAVDLLTRLGALDPAGRVTDHGRRLAELPLHPRLAHLAVSAADRGLGALACDLVALLADRDVLTVDDGAACADLAARVAVLADAAPPPRGTRPRRGAVDRARREARRLRRALDVPGGHLAPERVGELLALAYPDRLAAARGERGRYLLASGRGGALPDHDPLAGEPLLVVADVDDRGADARIHLAAAVDTEAARRSLGDQIRHETVVAWERGDVVAERRERAGAVTLDARTVPDPDDAATTAALLDGLRTEGLDLLPWSRDTRQLQARMLFLRGVLGDDWPDVSDEALLATPETWLAPFLAGRHRRGDLATVPLADALRSRLAPPQVGELDELAPAHLQVPTGSRIRLDYTAEDGPVLAVRLQELFGATRTPRVAGGRVPVLLHLLSPAQRPVQVTRDLGGFWDRAYPRVRRELRGRYPKHHWPEDPRHAAPTRRTRRG